MKAAERRDAIIKKLKNSAEPLSGAALAQELGVSRQVIVQDISILRAQGNEVLSTNRGYVLQHSEEASRVFKVIHTEEEEMHSHKLHRDGGSIGDGIHAIPHGFDAIIAISSIRVALLPFPSLHYVQPMEKNAALNNAALLQLQSLLNSQ